MNMRKFARALLAPSVALGLLAAVAPSPAQQPAGSAPLATPSAAGNCSRILTTATPATASTRKPASGGWCR